MSPDRLSLTRSEAIRRRKEEDEQRIEKMKQKRVSTPKPVRAAATPKPARSSSARLSSVMSRSQLRARYDVSMNPTRGQVRANDWQSPTFSLPQIEFGPRWFSFGLVLICVVLIYFYLNEAAFLAQEATIQGNQRLTGQEVNRVLGIANQPAALLNPAQIEYNIRAAFPEVYGTYVQVDFPAKVTITIAERQPVAAWVQDGQTVWVDAQGYAFPVRGQVPGLVAVTAAGAPPTPASYDPTQLIGARPFLTDELSAAITALSPHVPEGAALVYDPHYGLGWADPRGWQAYFGHNNGDMDMKFTVYQAMVDTLLARGIQPQLISVEYPNSPFYRVRE